MSQFPNKGPWGRNPGTQQVNPQIFTGQIGLSANQFGMPQMSLGGLVNVGGNLMPVNAVQFQTQQNLGGALNFGAQLANRPSQQPQQQQSSQQQKTQRSFMGFVTKMVENYGFIDEEVFFQSSVVKGPLPRVGDRVMCEAAFNPNMAFKWNAVRVQLIGQPAQQDQPPSVEQHRPEEQQRRWGPANERRERQPEVVSTRRKTPPRRSPPVRRTPPVRRRSPSPKRPVPPTTVAVANGDRLKRERPSRSPSRNTGDNQSRRSSRSPPARRARVTAGRHSGTNLPKMSLDKRHAGVPDLRRWFGQMYIPSDFIQSHFAWVKNFPLHRPLNLDHSIGYHILHKEVQRSGIIDDLNGPSSELLVDQPDADYRFCAKVMLLNCMPMQDLFRKVLTLQDDGTLKSDSEVGNINKEIGFLVGVKGKNEALAVGGPWSPSADGLDPANDPRVLIRTAIRTTRALTGIDLSKCTQWYKFLEVRYRRVDKEKKGQQQSASDPQSSAKVETVVIFVPDVWSVAPTHEEFESCQGRLKQRLEERLAELDRPKVVESALSLSSTVETPAEVSLTTGDIPTEAEPMETGHSSTAEDQQLNKSEVLQLNSSTDDSGSREGVKTEDASENGLTSGKSAPTHWSKLDIKSMKVVDLRIELEARGAESKGIKSQLVARLQKIATEEQDAEEKLKSEIDEKKEIELKPEAELNAVETVVEEKKPEEKKLSEKEEKEIQRQREKEEREIKLKKESLQRHYTLGKDPQLGLLVFPHSTAKSGRFDCKVVSLQALLDYRVEDNKEHSFEVALFAEMFQNMLVRDFSFKVYKSLLSAPDLVAEEKKKEEEKRQKEEEQKRLKELEKQQKEEQKKREAEQKALAEAAKNEAALNGTTDQKGESAEQEEQEEDLMDTAELQVKDEVKEETEVDQALKDSSDSKPDSVATAAGKSPGDTKKVSLPPGRSKSNDREKEKRISFVEKPDLLLAYSYFDQSGSGGLLDKDVEELLSSLGLHLSRAQITRLLKKQILHGDTLHYRKLTDSTKYKDKTTGEEVKQPLPSLPLSSDEEIAVGNNPFLLVDTTVAESTNSEGKSEATSIPDVTANASVIFQGAVVDLGQIFNQLRRMETEQKAVVQRSAALEKDLKSTKESVEILEKRKRRLEDDLKDTRRKLTDTEKYLKNSKDDTVMLKTALGRCRASAESVIRQVERVIPSERKKDETAASATKKVESKTEEQSTSVGPSADNSVADDDVQIVTPSSAAVIVSLPDGEQAEAEELAVKDEIIVESDKAEADME